MTNPVTIAAAYAAVPSANCQGKCQASCGLVPWSAAEWARIQRLKGSATPKFEQVGTMVLPMVVEGADGICCPLLSEFTGHCTVYKLRPILCRLWGVTESMPCEFGCTPERVVSDADAHQLIDDVFGRNA